MRAALRKLSMASPTPNRVLTNTSQRLANLAQQLRLYKPPPSSSDSEESEDSAIDARGKVFSSLAVPESAATQLPQPERFRPKKASVLVCLFEDQLGDLRVILTKRSSNLSTHSGEVSLPGGKAEEGDADEQETALREAREEIGLDPSLVSVVTVLEPFLSKHLLRVAPVVAILHDKNLFKPVLNADEVEEIFDAPLEMFLKDENRRWEEREWNGVKYIIHYFDFLIDERKFVIWGLTAGILIRAASAVYQRPPSFSMEYSRFKIPRSLNGNNSM
ncbi:nudix hydrolase 15, mitochondrial-like [Typha angustifolia]|uniref:nudix hydrolase 15, mitochondrial-like n=1 Tax=Typha angustifolia TaxID=59011 RepID=UPI003C30031E